MQFHQRNLDRLQSISDLYYENANKIDKNMHKENSLTTKIQAQYKMHVLRVKYKIIRNATIYIQKVVRGYLARLLMKRSNDTRYNERNYKYFSHQATVIQRRFRGFHYRKYYIDFATRQAYLRFLKEKNETFQKELEQIGQEEHEELKIREEQLARTEFDRLAANLHHLSSTRTQPGVYNRPYGTKDVVFDVDVESHLKIVFHTKTDVTIFRTIQHCQIKTFKMIIFFCFISAHAKLLTHSNVVLAIDCGSEQGHELRDYAYMEDEYFFGQSRIADYTYNEVVQNGLRFTLEPKVFFTERHGESFGYKIPIEDGQYTLILQFVELYFDNENDRQFDVFLGKKRVLHNFSILDNIYQKGCARQVYIEINVKDEQVFFRDELCEGGFDRDRLIVKFERGAADLPKIDGIILVKGEADQEENQNLVEQWDILIEKQKQKLQQQEQQQRQPDSLEPEIIIEEEGEDLMTFILSPLGLTIIGLMAFFFICINFVGQQQKQKK